MPKAERRPVGPGDAVPPAAGSDRTPAVPTTRTAKAWVALTAGTIGLIVVLIFILQNLKSVRVSFLFVHWKLPLALDLLLAALLGGAVVLTAGSIRIVQLRRTARRNYRDTGGSHQ